MKMKLRMNGHKRIIGFAGRKRSGKSMLSEAIKNVANVGLPLGETDVEIIAIADNLKNLCCDLLNVNCDRLNRIKDDGTTFEKTVDEVWVSTIHEATGIANDVIWNEIGGRTFTNVREVLQVIGTDLIRKNYPDWHIDKTIEKINNVSEDKLVIVDDIRFPNEKFRIEEIGGEVFFVIRPNCFDVSNHPSETALSYDNFLPKNVIINDLPKDIIAEMFITSYFDNYEPNKAIFLSHNPWYTQNVMDDKSCGENFTTGKHLIIDKVLEYNLQSTQFKLYGILTYHDDDRENMALFRRVIMNDRRNSDGKNAYAIYNPLTNEILKKYLR